MTGRRAGLMVPLFSLRSANGWGIGEMADLGRFAAWMQRGGFQDLMMLPLGTMTAHDPSPYSGSSTMAIDPIFITVDEIVDFARVGGVHALPPELAQDLAGARAASHVEYARVRRVKAYALGAAFSHFYAHEWAERTARAAELAAYIDRERWWLDDYALFQSLSRMASGARWRDWAAPLRDREPAALIDVRRHLSREILQEQYWQWIAESQWQEARQRARACGVRVWGDLPFVAGGDSADVWSRPQDYLLDVSVGTPPDAFSAEGQDWGMPMYHWHAMAASGYDWIRQRAARMAALFDGIRIDHLVGFFRTFGRPQRGEPFFNPGDESAQRAQGEAVLEIFRASGAELVAEDLGTVPDFVRASLARLDVPGCKVLRWERLWHNPAVPFIDPAFYPEQSAAMTGTHDTDTLAGWWTSADAGDRAAMLTLPALAPLGPDGMDAPWSVPVRDALLDLAYSARSRVLFLPIQDIFGWDDRINVPGTVADTNWTWCLPWSLDRLDDLPEATERAAAARLLAVRHGRATD
jgi:4-alpha-glucanotransferase